MIVIATNNGKNYLPKLLNSLNELEYSIDVTIIDTQSNDTESIEFINNIDKDSYKFNISFLQTPYRGFDTGAYIYAIRNIKNVDRFYFLQDSIVIKDIKLFDEINKRLCKGKVVPLVGFRTLYDNQEQIDFCNDNFGSSYYKCGIFGPMFSILKEDIELIDDNLLVYPNNKNIQMAMERGWSVIFNKYDLNVEPIYDYDYEKIMNDGYQLFNKTILNRQ